MKQRRNIAILGSTGSIGRNTLEVISNFPDEFRVTYLAAHQNVDLLKEQISRFRPSGVAMLSRSCADRLRASIDGSAEVLTGDDGLVEVVKRPDVDIVVSALVGFAGLRPTLCAIEAGKDIALANKETLVVAGELIMARVREKNVRLLPVDSEHSAITQCLQGERIDEVSRLILTASGGPLLHTDKQAFEGITVAQALSHPTWKMGNKITIDSATLMNKGLEVIEAHWLFGLPSDNIDVVIHPQSIIHSMVEFRDGSVKAQMGVPDMKLPIQYALMYPRRPASVYQRMDFERIHQMTFLKPDLDKFPCLALAREALNMGGTAPAVLNAANEVAVQLFLEERLSFASIPALIEEALSFHRPIQNITLNDVIEADSDARARIMRHSAVAS